MKAAEKRVGDVPLSNMHILPDALVTKISRWSVFICVARGVGFDDHAS